MIFLVKWSLCITTPPALSNHSVNILYALSVVVGQLECQVDSNHRSYHETLSGN